jgi:hypothetical protein
MPALQVIQAHAVASLRERYGVDVCDLDGGRRSL